MIISTNWLKELVDLKVEDSKLPSILSLRTVGSVKEITGYTIDIDIKGYNRADYLSLRGLAYDIAAVSDSPVKFEEPDPSKYAWVNQTLPQTNVKVEEKTLAPLYCIAKIEGLKVAPSSKEWKEKLESSGVRSVNNVADVTNLVMLEYGQPLHAFDAKAFKDETIIVRTAKEGERITTLDGKTRDLTPEDLLITDPQNALGIAGVMGGKDSEVSDSTTSILLEAAIFDPVALRKTATRLNLASEAAKRFYHGLTKKRLMQALDAAVRMYQDLGGKLTALTIVDNFADKEIKVTLNQKKTNSLIGVEISAEDIEKYLKKLHFSLKRHPEGVRSDIDKFHLPGGVISWEVTPPYWRLDIAIEEDLVEEVARMYGYERIPSTKLSGQIPAKVDQSLFKLLFGLKKAFSEAGLTEIQTYSFFSTAVLENLEIDKGALIKIANPISSETEYMRNHIWPNLVEVVDKNIRTGFDDIAIFEVGKVYQFEEEKPQEEYHLALALMNNTDNPTAELFAIFKKALQTLSLEIETSQRGKHGEKFHPTRYLRLNYKGQDIGKIGEVHPKFVNRFGIEKRAAVVEINLEYLK